ncbi:MAG TPA: response regulator [Candidatus Brocadiia bacterium]|nr:response regulator [Candidatus Brocadiia bacterium]
MNRERVLLIGPETQAQRLLEALGYAVIARPEGVDAAALAAELKPAAVVALAQDAAGAERAAQSLAACGAAAVIVAPAGDMDLARRLWDAGAAVVMEPLTKVCLGSALALAMRQAGLARRLRQVEDQYSLLADNVSDVVWTRDMRLRLTYVSPSIQRFLGYTAEEMRALPQESLLESSSLRRALAAFEEERRALERGGPEAVSERTIELEYVRKDGSTVWAETRSWLMLDASGRASGVASVSREVTSRRRLEEELRRSQKLEAVGKLAGGIAHEFNNLLTAILGHTDMILLDGELAGDVRAAVGEIARAAERAGELTGQLLGFARKGKYRLKPMDLHETIRDVARFLEKTASRPVRVEMNLRADPSWVSGDPGQLRQVMMNLGLNACDAMPQGGALRFATEVVDADEAFRRNYPDCRAERYLAVSVSDTGVGIPKAFAHRVFEPFFTTKPQGEGTGLGLAMVYGVVKNHGGAVGFVTQEGRGTTFRLYLPLCAPPAPAGAEAAGPAVRDARRAVLVVDDEEVVRDVASAMLARLGYQVHTAANGREAVEQYRLHGKELDLVILDMIMPVMDGRDCFVELRRIDPDVKAVLCTGYGRDERARDLLDMGMRGLIQKPFRFETLTEAVARAVGG